MWSVTPEEILHLRSPGGDAFTRVVDALIRAHAAVLGIAQTDVSTNQRTNIGDQGVDTEVRAGVETDPSGWLPGPTCWQFKATSHKGFGTKKLIKELKKPYCRKLVQRGFAYRFCICDEMPAVTKAHWEKELNAAIREVNPDAPAARVITAGDLAEQATRFRAIVLRFFRPELGKLLHIASWQILATRLTKVFVPVPSWLAIQQQVGAHADISAPVADVVYTVQGKAGVGKTRLVI